MNSQYSVACNICGCVDFIDMISKRKLQMKPRIGVRCKNCHSLQRTRLFWLYIEKLNIMPNFKILHLAPERGIYNRLKNIISPENYVTADFDPSRYGFSRARKIDLTQMDEWKSNEFDLIIHIHVMEHVPCNLAYSFFHLHRMLKDGGKHMFIIPILDGVYDECFDKISDEERTLRFGQYDHVRKFGRDGLLMTLGKFINLPDSFDATNDFSEELLLNSNIPKPYWKGMHGGTVFTLEKDSYKLK